MTYEIKDTICKMVKDQGIFVNGEEVGELSVFRSSVAKEDDPIVYHASIKICIHSASTSLAQGFGATPDEAIRNAFVRGRKETERFLAGIAEMEKAFFDDRQ